MTKTTKTIIFGILIVCLGILAVVFWFIHSLIYGKVNILVADAEEYGQFEGFSGFSGLDIFPLPQ